MASVIANNLMNFMDMVKGQSGGNSCSVAPAPTTGGAPKKAAAKKGKGKGKPGPTSLREKLNAKTVEQLKQQAVRLGIKIYKRKDGKLVPVKKSTLVNNICAKYGV